MSKSSRITHIIIMCITTETDECCRMEEYVGVLTRTGSVYINQCGIEPSNIKSISVPTINIVEKNGIRNPNPLVVFK